jgi:asparagine synthase (glutamine-hydrolysing)
MCGIAGFSHSAMFDRSRLGRALHSIEHRGPDQQGEFHSASMSMGARRLRVIDIEGGDQPFSSADGEFTLVFNGEIFNHKELRAELAQAGHQFRSRCDTEVVLAAYQHWGKAAFEKLRGMFAAALWVRSKRSLVLARDRMGIKPLYYCVQDDEIYFGSEIKCILAHPEVNRKLSMDGLNCYLSLNYVPGPHTMIDGIFKLMPGHVLEFRNRNACVTSYPTLSVAARAPASLNEASEQLDGLMRSAIREQLDADVPLGIWLSGGLDSSAVLHYAASLSSSPLKTFSITFNGRSFNDGDFVRQVSRHYGTEHAELNLDSDCNLIEAIDALSYHADEPNADAGAIPVWFLSRMTRQNATVALSGEGADELFGGYLTHKADRYAAIARGVPGWLRKWAYACAQTLPVSDEKIGFEYKAKRFLKGLLLSPEFAHVYWNGTFSESEKEQVFQYADPRPLARILGTMKGGSGLERFLQFDQRYYLPDDILAKVDRMSMAHAVEVRPPFLDPRIVDFAASLPERFKLTRAGSKLVLRNLMHDKLPQSVLTRPKTGLDIPIHEWFRGALRPLLRDTLSEEYVRRSGLFHWPVVQSLLEQHQARKGNWGYHLWGLLTLTIWMRRWAIELPNEWAPAPLPQEAVAVADSSLHLQPV